MHYACRMTALSAYVSERKSLVDVAYEALLGAIFDQALQPGERLRIDALARTLDMSITPVREALVRASAERLVVQTSNRGFAVAPLLSPQEYHDLFAARLAIESAAVAAARAVDEAALGRLRQLSALIGELPSGPSYGEFGRFSAADREFHRALVGLSSNSFLVAAWEGLHAHLHHSRLYAGAGVIDFDDALREHEAILAALAAGDTEAAAEAAGEHIHNAERRLASLLPVEQGQ